MKGGKRDDAFSPIFWIGGTGLIKKITIIIDRAEKIIGL